MLEFRDRRSRFVPIGALLVGVGDLENSRFIQSTGESGNVFSPLYRNFAERWAKVQYLPMRTKRETVEKGKLGILTLTP